MDYEREEEVEEEAFLVRVPHPSPPAAACEAARAEAEAPFLHRRRLRQALAASYSDIVHSSCFVVRVRVGLFCFQTAKKLMARSLTDIVFAPKLGHAFGSILYFTCPAQPRAVLRLTVS